jgi:hypothetical protein
MIEPTPHELRQQFPEETVRALLDGLPYHRQLESLCDAEGKRLLDVYEIRNRYNGNLMGKLRTEWTYWDNGKVREMTVYDGIGDRRVTIVHRDEKGQPIEVETRIIPADDGVPNVSDVKGRLVDWVRRLTRGTE